MRRGFLLLCLLLVKLRCGQSSCEEPESRKLTSLQQVLGLTNPRANLIKRYSDLDYDSFVGLMGRRDAAAGQEEVQYPKKREMHDIFVGLMGRRNSEPGFSRGCDKIESSSIDRVKKMLDKNMNRDRNLPIGK